MNKAQLIKAKEQILKRMRAASNPLIADVVALLAINRDLARLAK